MATKVGEHNQNENSLHQYGGVVIVMQQVAAGTVQDSKLTGADGRDSSRDHIEKKKEMEAELGGIVPSEGSSNRAEIDRPPRFAEEHNKKGNSLLQSGEVVTVTQQVVAGTVQHSKLTGAVGGDSSCDHIMKMMKIAAEVRGIVPSEGSANRAEINSPPPFAIEHNQKENLLRQYGRVVIVMQQVAAGTVQDSILTGANGCDSSCDHTKKKRKMAAEAGGIVPLEGSANRAVIFSPPRFAGEEHNQKEIKCLCDEGLDNMSLEYY